MLFKVLLVLLYFLGLTAQKCSKRLFTIELKEEKHFRAKTSPRYIKICFIMRLNCIYIYLVYIYIVYVRGAIDKFAELLYS